MALFSDSDFNKILIPIDEEELHKNKTALQIFGKITLADVPYIKYIALIYDKHSPLRTKIPDVLERKNEASIIAGIKGNKDSLFDLSYSGIIDKISAYLKHQNSKIWAILLANEEVLWQYQSELFTPITEFKTDKDKLQALEIKSKLMAECDAIIKRIDSYEDKLFGDITEKKEEILNFTPETIANL